MLAQRAAPTELKRKINCYYKERLLFLKAVAKIDIVSKIAILL